MVALGTQPRSARAQAGRQPRLAILRDRIEGLDLAVVDGLSAALTKAGFVVEPVTCEQMASAETLNPKRVDCLVLTHSPHFPAIAGDNFLRFLKGGGDVVLMGGRAFAEPVCKIGDRWVSEKGFADSVASVPTTKLLFDFNAGDFAAWRRLAKHADRQTRLVSGRGKVGKCLRMDIDSLAQWSWDNHGTRLSRGLPADHNLLCFWAKGGKTTPQMAIELAERDGSRWIAVIDLSAEWRRYALSPRRFRFWRDGSPKGRGGKGDGLKMADVARLSMGLAWGITRQPEGDHTLWIDEIGSAKIDLPEGIDFSARVDLDLVYRDCEPYTLRDVERIACPLDWAFLEDLPPIEGRFDGPWAIGFPLPGQGGFLPLRSAFDRHGRDRGWAAAQVTHYAGEFKGSTWLLVSVTTPAFYRHKAFAQELVSILRDDMPYAEGTMRRADARAAAATLELRTLQVGSLRLSDDGKHIVHPNGRRFFMIGCNYVGPFDRRVWSGHYTVENLQSDFRMASEAGLNCMRVYSAKSFLRDPKLVTALKECARRHHIYLILELGGTGKVQSEKTDIKVVAADHQRLARLFADEPMVLGYDLKNEPYVTTVGGLLFDGKPSPLLKLRAYERYAGQFDREAVDRRVKARPAWPRFPKWLPDDEARHLYAAHALWHDLIKPVIGPDGSTFPGLKGKLPVAEKHRELFDAVDATFDEWLRVQIEAIRAVDRRHLITVGYNTVLAALPCNRRLDFVSEHVYQRPHSLADVLRNVTTLDRLAKLWPGKPISLGEFGYSNGTPAGDGYLDFDTSAVGEMIHYLYALAHGYEGCKKWMLVDWPLPYTRRYAPWIADETTRVYEERFGLYYYDGTPRGRPKPIVHALRFLRRYVDRAGPGGTLDIRPGPAPIGAIYVYKGDQALFVGAAEHKTSGIEFRSRRPANVMLDWHGGRIRLMSSADATATIEPAVFLPKLPVAKATVTGRRGAFKFGPRALTIELLAGETVTIR